jgi:RHS repeat-associated protein
MQVTDGNQNVVASYKYDAWGNDLIDPQSPLPNPFKYVGGLGYYADRDSGLMLLGKRYYCAGVGRFWSLDPAKDGFNWYEYANGNPVRYIDPTGLGCLDKGLNDPTCWWYWMRQRETWCEISPWYCCMYRCFAVPVFNAINILVTVAVAAISFEQKFVGYAYLFIPWTSIGLEISLPPGSIFYVYANEVGVIIISPIYITIVVFRPVIVTFSYTIIVIGAWTFACSLWCKAETG